MANIKSAKKRANQAVVRNARNTSHRSMLRTLVKKVIKALEAKDAAAAEARLCRTADRTVGSAVRRYAPAVFAPHPLPTGFAPDLLSGK